MPCRIKLGREHQHYAAKANEGAATRVLSVTFGEWIYEAFSSACKSTGGYSVKAQHPHIWAWLTRRPFYEISLFFITAMLLLLETLSEYSFVVAPCGAGK